MSPRPGIFALLLAASLCWSAEAAITVVTDAGATYTTSGLTRYSTRGADMAGMSVTGFFTDGSFQSITWGSSGAFGANWSLTESGDTFGSLWTLRNTSGLGMTRLVLDGAPGDTLFDVAVNGLGGNVPGYAAPVAGTAGSENGWTFQARSAPAGLDLTATYRNMLQLGVDTPFGDLWTTLDLLFTNQRGFASGASPLTFIADTDNAAIRGSIVPSERFIPDEAVDPAPTDVVVAATPEPGSLLLMGGLAMGALLGGGACRRRQRGGG